VTERLADAAASARPSRAPAAADVLVAVAAGAPGRLAALLLDDVELVVR